MSTITTIKGFRVKTVGAIELLNRHAPILGTSILTLVKDSVSALNDNNCQKCLENCRILLDFCWEKLNTGHWKDVQIAWRYMYSVISFIKAVALTTNIQNYKESLKAADMGLLMGAAILNNILAQFASVLHQTIVMNEKEEESCDFTQPKPKKFKEENYEISMKNRISRVDSPDLFDFQCNYLLPHKPVILTGTIDHWPAVSKWSVHYIKQVAKYRTVPVEVGSRYTADTWSQKLMTVEEFIETYLSENTTEIGYLAQHQLFDQITELKDDFSIPDYCFLSSEDTVEEHSVDVNAWFGPGGTVSPMHQDPRENMLAQVYGRKYVRLIDVKHTESVYPFKDGIMTNTSQVDVESPDYQLFPDFKTVPYFECILGPGQMLFIPKKWWHFVKSLSNSFSISFWFGD